MNLTERLRLLGAQPAADHELTSLPIEPAVRMPLPGAVDDPAAHPAVPAPRPAPQSPAAREIDAFADLLPNPFMTIGRSPAAAPAAPPAPQDAATASSSAARPPQQPPNPAAASLPQPDSETDHHLPPDDTAAASEA